MKLFEFDANIGDWRTLVQTRDIQNGAVRSQHIAGSAVTGDKIAGGEIKSRHIADDAVTGDKIADGTIPGSKLTEGCITGDKIVGGTVKQGKLADNAVAERNIQPHSVTGGKIADGAIRPVHVPQETILHITKDVQNQIDGIQIAGVAVSNEFGNDPHIGISQKKLTEEFANYQEKVGDKEYSAEDFSGLGRVYLKKNLVNIAGEGEEENIVNLLTQDMFMKEDGVTPNENCIFVIQYDYVIDPQASSGITVPENCILSFQGGSVSNGTIVGDDTTIIEYEGNDVLRGVTVEGVTKYSSALNIVSDFDAMLEKDNMLANPFFKSSVGWSVENCNIHHKKLVIDGLGSASQTMELLGGHRYLIACYGRITNVTQEERSQCRSFWGRYGLGFRVRSSESYNGAYKLNVDFVGNRSKSDFVPIIYVLDVYEDVECGVSFGEIYDGNGTIKGEMLHAGVYDISNTIVGIPSYKDLYMSYKRYVEDSVRYKSTLVSFRYPDTMADEAFIDEMNKKAICMSMTNTVFNFPHGSSLPYDKFNNSVTYKTSIQPSNIREGHFVTTTGGEYASGSYDTYTYDVSYSPSKRYLVRNLKIGNGVNVALAYFYKDNVGGGVQSFTTPDLLHVSRYYDMYEQRKEDSAGRSQFYISIPVGVNRIKLTSLHTETPELICLSETPINSSSEIINGSSDRSEFRLKDGITSAKDICILNGIAALNRKIQEAWNVQTADAPLFVSGGKTDSLSTVQMARANNWFNNKYFVIYGKGGSGLYRTEGTSTIYKEIGFGLCLKDRSTGRIFALSLIRSNYLPEYNNVTALPDDADLATALQTNEPDIYAAIESLGEGEYYTVSDTILSTYYPSISARKALNNSSYDIYDKLVSWYQEKEGYEDFDPENDLDWDSCAVCEVFPDNPFIFNEIGGYRPGGAEKAYYSSLEKKYADIKGKNIYEAVRPMSITKTMTLLVATQYMSLSDLIEYKEQNMITGSGRDYADGEYFSFRDAVILLLSVSDNSIAADICSQAGQKILKSRYSL